MYPEKTQIPENTNDGVGRLNKLKLAYRDGYIHGRELEHHIQEENQSNRATIRQNDKAAGGLLFGITITAIASLLGGTVFLLTHQNHPSPTPVQSAPTSQSSQP